MPRHHVRRPHAHGVGARPERGWVHPLTIVRHFAAIAYARRSPCGVRWARSAPWQGRAVRLHPSAAASLRRLCRRAGGALRPPRPAPPRVQPLREHYEAPCAAGPHGALPLPTGSGHCWGTTPLQNASGRGPPPPTRAYNTICPPGTHAGWWLWRPLCQHPPCYTAVGRVSGRARYARISSFILSNSNK